MTMRPVQPDDWKGYWLIETKPPEKINVPRVNLATGEPILSSGSQVIDVHIRHREVLRDGPGGTVGGALAFVSEQEAQDYIDGKTPPVKPVIHKAPPPEPEAEPEEVKAVEKKPVGRPKSK